MLQVGDRVADRYTVVRHIGDGGMGGVYEVRGDALSNRLALKVLKSELLQNASLRARFEREARIQSRLEHPGIARVFDLVDLRDTVGIVMEYIEASTLRQFLSKGRPSASDASDIAMEIAVALMAAHEADIVHRDIKPENIFVWTDRLGRYRCKLIDFGIAKQVAVSSSVGAGLTRTGSFIGTYAYASPEQITCESPIDHRSDLYSLGVVLWEMLAGVAPYQSLSSGYSIQSAVVNDDLPRLPDDVPDTLQRVVAELTRKAPAERVQSADELLGLLHRRQGSLNAATQAPGIGEPDPPAPDHGTKPAETVVRAVSATAATTLQTNPSGSPTVPPSEPGPTSPHSSPRGPLVFGPTLQPAEFGERLMARLFDELLPQLVQLTCLGIFAYPFMVIRLGGGEHPSSGRVRYRLRVYSVLTGKPVHSGLMTSRNLYDFFVLQLPLLGLTSPLSWLLFPLPFLAAVWLGFVLCVELAPMLLGADNRRLVDRLLGTQVCREPQS